MARPLRPRRKTRRKVLGPRPKAPFAAALSLALAYRSQIDRWLELAMLIVDAWVPVRRDARSWVDEKLKNLEAEISDTPSRIEPTVELIARRVEKGASTFEGRLYDEHGKYLGMGTKEIQNRKLARVSMRNATGISIDRYRAANIARIKSIGSERLGEFRELLEQAETEGWQVDVLRKKVQEQFDVSKSKADLLARDQTLKLGAAITQERQTQAGIKKYQWSTSGDERVRDGGPRGNQADHKSLDGTIQSWDDPPDNGVGENVHPGEDFQCRCVAIPVLPDISELPDLDTGAGSEES
jgi:SPP1 gp7 family putative phage head morphogenesis protein